LQFSALKVTIVAAIFPVFSVLLSAPACLVHLAGRFYRFCAPGGDFASFTAIRRLYSVPALNVHSSFCFLPCFFFQESLQEVWGGF
jgi:hypothetical protein